MKAGFAYAHNLASNCREKIAKLTLGFIPDEAVVSTATTCPWPFDHLSSRPDFDALALSRRHARSSLRKQAAKNLSFCDGSTTTRSWVSPIHWVAQTLGAYPPAPRALLQCADIRGPQGGWNSLRSYT